MWLMRRGIAGAIDGGARWPSSCIHTGTVRRTIARRPDTDIGDRVLFPLASVFLPELKEVLLTAASEVEGRIIDFSDSGTRARQFAIIELVHKRRVVVPTADLRVAEPQA
jgi:hypothetical protein